MFEHFINPGTPHAVFWLFVAIGVIIQGISKSGFAGGAALLSVPLMMLVMPVDKVAATLLPVLILCDLNAIYFYRRDCVWKHVWAIYVPAIGGILLGAAVWWWIGTSGVKAYEDILKRFVGVIAILFSIYILAAEISMAWVQRFRFGARAAWPIGFLAGFCSTIAHSAGPVVGLYMFAQHMGKTLFVGSTAWTFTLINLTKLPFYCAVGLIKRDVLLFDLLLVWLIPIGSFLGKWMHHRVSESLFNRIILGLTLIAGVELTFHVKIIQFVYEALFSVK